VAKPSNPPRDFLDQTVEVWERNTGRRFSRDEAAEAVANFADFLSVFIDWESAERRPSEAGRPGRRAPGDSR